MSILEYRSLRKEKKKRRSILDIIPVFIWILNSDGIVVYANHACSKLFDIKATFLLGKKMKEFIRSESTMELIEEARAMTLKSEEPVNVEIMIKSGDETERVIEVYLKKLKTGKKGKVKTVFTAFDITEQKKNEQKLFHQSMHDFLTGLYNRLFFNEELNRLNTVRQFPLSLVLCDVDGLKIVNDVMGHERGDELLKKVARVLRDTFRSCDVVARVGGDEFAVILPQTDSNTAHEICKRLEQTLFIYNQEKKGIFLSVSTGAATQKTLLSDVLELFAEADREMYRKKLFNRKDTKQKIFESMMFLLPQRDFLNLKHEELVQQLSLLLGNSLGLNEEELQMLLLLCKFHDIGNILIKDSILFKKAPLDGTEWDEIKLHPEMGYRIALLWPDISNVAECILQHHERWDGSGYPRGIRGEEITLCSRVFTLVDSYVSMVTPRPYREAYSHENALEEIYKEKGKHFDPVLVDIFFVLMEKNPLD